MNRSYVIIEDMSLRRRRSFRPFEETELASSEPEPPDIAVSEASLPQREANQIRGSQGITIAPADVEMYLVEPYSSGVSNGDADAEWGLKQVGALTSDCAGEGVTVAVLDTGIDRAHPAFAHLGDNLVEEDFSGSGNGDVKGHGTHCAGTIFGRPVNGRRIGVAPGVKKALIGKIFTDPGSGRPSTSGMALNGLSWAIGQQVDVISMSIGIDLTKTSERLALTMNPRAADALTLQSYADLVRAFDALMAWAQRQTPVSGGIVVVAAAGNESDRPNYEITASLPANANHVISVGALQQAAGGVEIAKFSNSFPRISGPGVGIQSAWPGGGLMTKDGTSMACPHVAGVAALWWEKVRKLGLPRTAETVRINMLHAAAQHRAAVVGQYDNSAYGAGVAYAPQPA